MITKMLRALSTLCFVFVAGAALAQSVTVVEGQGRVINLDREAASVFVGDPGIADVQAVSGQALLLAGISPGSTNVFALDFEDNVIAQYRVRVVPNNDDAAAILSDGADGVTIRQSGNAAVIVGQADSVGEALASLDAQRALEGAGRTVVDRTELKGGTQIALRVRFVEASRRDLYELGFSLNATNDGVSAGNPTSGSADFAEGGLDIAFGGSIGDTNIDAVLTALERRGIVQILSEPTLTTTSGVRANFSAGGEFAFPVNQGDGVITAEYKEFGVSVDFLPTLLPNGRIALEVAPEVSFIDEAQGVVEVEDFVAPSLSVRRAETTVEVGSGQTFAIAGLYEQFASDADGGVPGFRSGPLRGLFGNRQQRRDERELVIFITPYLSEPTDIAERNRRAAPRVEDTIGFIIK